VTPPAPLLGFRQRLGQEAVAASERASSVVPGGSTVDQFDGEFVHAAAVNSGQPKQALLPTVGPDADNQLRLAQWSSEGIDPPTTVRRSVSCVSDNAGGSRPDRTTSDVAAFSARRSTTARICAVVRPCGQRNGHDHRATVWTTGQKSNGLVSDTRHGHAPRLRHARASEHQPRRLRCSVVIASPSVVAAVGARMSCTSPARSFVAPASSDAIQRCTEPVRTRHTLEARVTRTSRLRYLFLVDQEALPARAPGSGPGALSRLVPSGQAARAVGAWRGSPGRRSVRDKRG